MSTHHPRTHDGPASSGERGSRRVRTQPAASEARSEAARASLQVGEARMGGPASRERSAGRADTTGASPDGADLAREAVVRLHAYHLWERRGRHDGHAIDDWLQAESDLVHLSGQPASRLPGPGVKGTR